MNFKSGKSDKIRTPEFAINVTKHDRSKVYQKG